MDARLPCKLVNTKGISMAISLFDLFKIGIGPSSSHTVGPMIAANRFAHQLKEQGLLTNTHRITVDLYGSLGATGKGHGTGTAVLMGLEGEMPESIDPTPVSEREAHIKACSQLHLLGQFPITMTVDKDLIYHRVERLDFHANGMTLKALDQEAQELHSATFYSIGGGFIVGEDAQGKVAIVEDQHLFHMSFIALRRYYSFAKKKTKALLKLSWTMN